MNENARSTDPKHGTVSTVRLPDSQRGEGRPTIRKGFPTADSRVVVELVGHRHRYAVRVAGTEDEPVLTELCILSDDASPIDYAAVKSVPVRRLAHAAHRWLSSGGGLFAQPGEDAESFAQPEKHTPQRRTADRALLLEVAGHVADAVAAGLPVQKHVAERMNASTATVDRWIRKAKEWGVIEDAPLPRRKRGY
ncbi:helix-turn-helix domain-containing protein [Nocardia cyriacigeorgica]|uniref:helix-turn-helix domain-containing protein n=1 Tax=Nocardia cyriacigeorgica TaxID=135487 RepID=UPI001895582D|nr:helix-turn-helix domain-containing protein [Nocardia cyriacigeorgica]MBF6161064.1 helix-turn-helix domain-containing protein [Nocardia cyriacigeorgica]MBF6199863.1 helix-turn-helix domain-containing protein [Nocardia cyriacigeorgica]